MLTRTLVKINTLKKVLFAFTKVGGRGEMGFSFRKSKKIAPGVRATVSKSGISLSASNKFGGVSRSTSGRTTKHVSIPGTGITYRKSKKG